MNIFRLYTSTGSIHLFLIGVVLSFSAISNQAQEVTLEKTVFSAGEDIVVAFSNGPSNAKDWVGLYAEGSPNSPSIIWQYVDGTQSGADGLSAGNLTFIGGLAEIGSYDIRFFENDGYTLLADIAFSVAATGPSVSIDKTTYAPGEPIVVNFNNGPSNAKDWVGLYAEGSPNSPSIIWQYVDGTQSGADGLPTGTLTFIDGLSEEGSYDIRFFENDGYTLLADIAFSIAAGITLPDPIYFENFDSVDEFALPEGWSVVNFSLEINFEADPDDFTSSLYEGWTNVSLDRWRNSAFWSDKAPGPNPPVTVNGVDQYLSGNTLVADSASRNADFITFLQTADIDLTGHRDIHLAFYSHYMQNQDSFGSIEYSVNGGQTWLPVVYLMDTADIVTDAEGNIDAVGTFLAEHTDIAVGFDEVTFVEYGFDFASYIGAEVTSDLAPFISGRINDNSTESKRFEIFRLPEADNNQVRFRIGKTGTWSWYWAIDNFGLYSIAPENAPKVEDASIPPGSTDINPQPLLVFTIKVGANSLDPNTVRLELDGEPVDGVLVEKLALGAETGYEVSYQVSELLEPATTHNYQLSFQDKASPPNDVSYNGSFTIQDYLVIDLPEPLYFEDFDDLNEFMLPEGWSIQNYIDPNDPDIQFDANPDDWFSTLYAGWANVTLERWQTSPFWADKAPGPDPVVVVNETPQYLSGKFLIADSASRNAQFATTLQTKDYDLSNQAGIHLGFYSHYEQNQDNSASLEYSIDKGQTWLPVLYMMDIADIVTDDEGTVDAVATFNAEHDDVAVAYDEETFLTEIGRTFGSFIGAEISQNLAPFISGRLDDNDVESKRFELFRLEQADNQAQVRFRVAMNGTWSWYWVIDNFGIYSIDTAVDPVALSISHSSGEIILTWPGGAGIGLQQTNRLKNPEWQDIGEEGQNSFTQPVDQKESYYRLIKN